MSNFMYLFRGGDENFKKLSQEEKQAHMEVWGEWMGGLKEKGQLLDGLPLGDEGRVVHNKGQLVTNGPHAEGAEVVGGYLIVSAKDMDEAVELSKGCPIFDYDGAYVEVREIMTMDTH
ncbi:YciI family protein [Muricauda sp. 2012CJ35-5]|uniref:YciI family protein n=1 Tax=Flagellimonas spongiicola TaxID=2942208 RepID=A0ABT0PTW2_9FLAO|nr:YciI family protein [Allomuricauda spongiicola]MCL6274421.1 YciI family protein [Allomuricauda spongiicola]